MKMSPQDNFDYVNLYDELWVKTGIIYLLLGVSVYVISQTIKVDDWVWHGLFCCLSLFILLIQIGSMMLRKAEEILYNYRLTFVSRYAFFFLIGSSQYYFDEDYAVAKMLAQYYIDVNGALEVDAMNSIGIGVTLIASVRFYRTTWLADRVGKGLSVFKGLNRNKVIMTLGMTGGLAYFRVLIHDLDPGDEVISGLWRSLQGFLYLAIFLSVSQQKMPILFRGVTLFVTLALSFMGVINFAKGLFVAPLSVYSSGLAFRMQWSIVKTWLLIAVIGLGSVSLLGDAVDYCRNHASEIQATSITERWNLLMEGFTQAGSLDKEDKYSTWGRINYLPWQRASMDLYNLDWGGDDFENAIWILVPRILYPDKPIMSNTGSEFYRKITGHGGSSTGQGLYANGYYNKGWPGVVLVGLITGWLIRQSMMISFIIVNEKALVLYPFAFGLSAMCGDVAGNLVSSYLGAFIIFITPLLILTSISSRR